MACSFPLGLSWPHLCPLAGLLCLTGRQVPRGSQGEGPHCSASPGWRGDPHSGRPCPYSIGRQLRPPQHHSFTARTSSPWSLLCSPRPGRGPQGGEQLGSSKQCCTGKLGTEGLFCGVRCGQEFSLELCRQKLPEPAGQPGEAEVKGDDQVSRAWQGSPAGAG